ncbi:hypothetical protein B7C51_24815 (plasmid) [Paenibacillus larvae subsp. pulvifaciens]|uniref:Uncharacterized protein n=1 Tax=Paenibacillus larvae subsp. pulvifaciens TaxID=1477 RepID=A0A1V0UZX1_9BACL|nr:hypothetical protein [Paenibacillus larvae]ARF70699.1 hypothetical protein B7C51_24815 [Paenibacillus larvae subsp. pulvifaciens]
MNHKSAITQLEEQWLRIEDLKRKYQTEKARADAAEEKANRLQIEMSDIKEVVDSLELLVRGTKIILDL